MLDLNFPNLHELSFELVARFFDFLEVTPLCELPTNSPFLDHTRRWHFERVVRLAVCRRCGSIFILFVYPVLCRHLDRCNIFDGIFDFDLFSSQTL